MSDTIKKELVYLVFTVLVTAVVAVVSIIAAAPSWESLSWPVVAFAGIRASASVLAAILGKYLIKTV